MNAPIGHRVRANGLEFQLYEWPGDGRPIFLAHATGFHARVWGEVVRALPGRHVYAPDMRGHGLSDKPEPPYGWRPFGVDVAAIAREIGLSGAIGVGHSKGGHAVTLAAALAPGAFDALLLIDPVIMPRPVYESEMAWEGEHFAARRRDRWQSAEEMFERFQGREPFSSWEPAVLQDYCEYGLIPADDGDGLQLACPPRIEAAIYMGNRSGGDIYPEIATLDLPVRILRARARNEAAVMDMTGSTTAPGLAAEFSDGEDVHLPEHSHFIPMEAPALAARHILELEQRLAG